MYALTFLLQVPLLITGFSRYRYAHSRLCNLKELYAGD